MRCNSPSHRSIRGFTLVELLVVIGIIALLISILLPSLHKARAVALRTACMSNMRQLGLAMMIYTNDNNGILPPAFFGYDAATGLGSGLGSGTGMSWDDYLARYVGVTLSQPELDTNNLNADTKVNDGVFTCPAYPSADFGSKRSYSMVEGGAPGNSPRGTGQFPYHAAPMGVAPGVKLTSAAVGTLLLIERLNPGNNRGGASACYADCPNELADPTRLNYPAHGLQNGDRWKPFLNWLFVDGHVENMTPLDSVSGDTTQGYLVFGTAYGMWTRDKND